MTPVCEPAGDYDGGPLLQRPEKCAQRVLCSYPNTGNHTPDCPCYEGSAIEQEAARAFSQFKMARREKW